MNIYTRYLITKFKHAVTRTQDEWQIGLILKNSFANLGESYLNVLGNVPYESKTFEDKYVQEFKSLDEFYRKITETTSELHKINLYDNLHYYLLSALTSAANWFSNKEIDCGVGGAFVRLLKNQTL